MCISLKIGDRKGNEKQQSVSDCCFYIAAVIKSKRVYGVHATISAYEKTNPLIVGNWKLNPTSQSDAVDLAAGVAEK